MIGPIQGSNVNFKGNFRIGKTQETTDIINRRIRNRYKPAETLSVI